MHRTPANSIPSKSMREINKVAQQNVRSKCWVMHYLDSCVEGELNNASCVLHGLLLVVQTAGKRTHQTGSRTQNSKKACFSFCKRLGPTRVCSWQTQVLSCQDNDAAQDFSSPKSLIAAVESRTLSEVTIKGCRTQHGVDPSRFVARVYFRR